MTPRPRANRAAKRAELTSAAARVFGERGVANTAVSDIVGAAGVAQGTFYLYFDSKDDVLGAVVEQMADAIVVAIESATGRPDATALEKFAALRDALSGFESDPGALELADFIHKRENRALHDRLTEHLAGRLVGIVEGIVAQGVAEGVFNVPDVPAAAWFVLSGLQSVELRATPAVQMPAALQQASLYALRALGYQGVV